MNNNEKKLEELLMKASVEPHQRPRFLENLLKSNIYCIGKTEGDKKESVLLEGSHVELMHFQDGNGVSYIPFFTSLESLQKALQDEQSYLKIPAKSFFELTLGTQLVLNPYNEYGKVFISQEVEDLINGNYGSPIESYEYKKNTEVLLSQPSQYPHVMVNELKSLLERIPQVKNAYLAQMHDVQRDPEPTFLIGFETDEIIDDTVFQKIKNQIGFVAYDSLIEKCFIDLIHIHNDNSDEGVARYLQKETEAFFKRENVKKKGFWGRLFSK